MVERLTEEKGKMGFDNVRNGRKKRTQHGRRKERTVERMVMVVVR